MKEFYIANKKWMLSGLFLLLAVFSFAVLADSSFIDSMSQDTIAYLEEKKGLVTGLTAATAATSVGINLIPGGDAVSETVAELSNYLLVVFVAIWLQKYLIGLTALLTFKVLIPLGLITLAVNIFLAKEWLQKLAIKLLLFATVFFFTIPSSIALSRQIEETHETRIEQTIQEVESSNKAVKEKLEESDGFLEGVQNAWNNMTSSMRDFLSDKMEEMQLQFSNMIDGVAVLIITTCVIPVMVFVFFLWCIRLLFGLEISIPLRSLPSRRSKKQKTPQSI